MGQLFALRLDLFVQSRNRNCEILRSVIKDVYFSLRLEAA